MSGKRKGKKRRPNAAVAKAEKAKRRKEHKKNAKKLESKMAEKPKTSIPRLEVTFPITDDDPLRHAHVQTLISHSLQPYVYTTKPQWCRFTDDSPETRRIVVAMMSYVRSSHVTRGGFPFLSKSNHFKSFPLLSPGNAQIALSGLDALLTNAADNKKKKKRNRTSDKTVSLTRRQCVLSPKDLLDNGFTVSCAMWEVSSRAGASETVCHERHMKTNGFMRLGRAEATSDDGEIPMYSIDCEMCETAEGMELTRLSVVNESLDCIYDTLVKPTNPITDYKTQFSGITEKSLENVTKTLGSVQRDLGRLLPAHAILIGHSLENDLFALKFIHDSVIDTSILYSTPASRAKYKPSLRYLSRKHLGSVREGLSFGLRT